MCTGRCSLTYRVRHWVETVVFPKRGAQRAIEPRLLSSPHMLSPFPRGSPIPSSPGHQLPFASASSLHNPGHLL